MNDDLRRQLDACRPGETDWLTDDLEPLRAWLNQSDSNREVAEQAQRVDAAIKNALCDVEVPSGLAERLKQSIKLAADSTPGLAEVSASDFDERGCLVDHEQARVAGMLEAENQEPSEAIVNSEPAAITPNSVIKQNQKVADQVDRSSTATLKSRRTLLRSLMLGATALAVLLACFFVANSWPRGETVSTQELGRSVASWDPNSAAGEWRQELDSAPARYPVSEHLNVRASQWKPFAVPYDSSAIVYDMSLPGNEQIYLYTIRSGDHFDLPSTFSENPIYSVNGFSVGACERNGIVYVLLVEGNLDRYRRVIKNTGEFV